MKEKENKLAIIRQKEQNGYHPKINLKTIKIMETKRSKLKSSSLDSDGLIEDHDY